MAERAGDLSGSLAAIYGLTTGNISDGTGYDYSLPFGPGKHWLNSGLLGNILGGWRVNGILTVMSGTPFTVTASGTALNTPGNTQTADRVAPVRILHGIGSDSAWFSASSFAQPTAAGVFGNTGRNALTGPGFFDLDASLLKVIKFKERYTLELRGEAFNITNTPQFSNPAAISPGATSATSRASPPAAAASTVSAAAAPSNSA